MPRRSRSDLEAYRRKRAAGTTPEPFGGGEADRPGIFVIQKHSARRLHYDLRFEVGGVLRSWAVPKGPSLDPEEKRLAVHTEDHPIEYGDFEGVIPADNYGAGAVILWDRGPTIHHVDPERGIEEGKLLFELRGFKLRGLWTLVRTSRNPKEWLLIKKPDGAATGEDATEMDPGSVLSGLTVEEMRDGHDRAAELRKALAEAGARKRRVRPEKVKLMLAELREEPFSRPGWLFELKYDGYRMLAAKDPATGSGERSAVRLLYRSGLDATRSYPDLALALRSLPYSSLVLDGEVVVLDEEARPSFGLLQQRARLSRPPDVERAAATLPAILYVFDLLGFEDFDLRSLPLRLRKELLRRILPRAGPLRFADHVEERGEALYRQIRGRDLEGLVAKDGTAPYRGGRSSRWIKIRADRTDDFAVVGFTRPKGSRSGFGALHLGVLRGARMVYAGRVGTGFGDRQLEEIRHQLEAMRRSEPAFSDPVPAGAEHVWVEPRLVAEVRYTEYTREGLLRQPVFLRLREDKRVEECVRDDVPPPPEEVEGVGAAEASPPRVRMTRPGKVFWPEEGYTKGDLIAFYREVSPWLLPYLRDRPVVLDRYPDGIEGKSFFQKNAPDFAPDWVRTEPIWSEDTGKENRYFVCNDEETLIYLANSAAIPLHVWSSRTASIQRPDWCILDLDAKQAELGLAVRVARAIHRLCKEIGLPGFVKTSGATGLHVLIPLGGQCTHEQSKQLAMLLAQLVTRELPEEASTFRTPARREGKIYVDALQNGYGKLLVAPFSVRPLPGATVSTPLRWSEVNSKLHPSRFTLATLPKRLARLKSDPWAKLLQARPDLPSALARLAELA